MPQHASATAAETERARSSGDAKIRETANARIRAEVEASETRLERVAQHFSGEWKKFLAYAMAIKQQQAGAGDDAERSGLEELLLQSQSGLVMLREMNHRRARKWQEIAELYGYSESPASESDASAPADAPQGLLSGDLRVEPSLSVAARLVALHQQRARMSRVFLAKTRQDTKSSQRHAQEREHAAVKALVEATQHQHRLEHAVGISASDSDRDTPLSPHATLSLHTVEPGDMEALLEYEHTRRRMALPLERLFVRMRWLCTSHRHHVRQRMLALFHRQRAKNAPVAVYAMVERVRNLNAVAASSATWGLMHCPLFVLSAVQLEAELAKLVHRHLPAHAASLRRGGADGGLASADIVELKVLVEQLFDQCVEATAIPPTNEGARGGSSGGDGTASESPSDSEDGGGAGGAITEQTPAAAEPFFAETRANSHWDIRQLDVLESSRLDESTSALAAEALAAREHDDDPLLRSEWDLLQLDDREYVRVRIGVLARSHSERARVDVSTSSGGSGGSGANTAERSDQLLGDDEPVSSDALFVLYMLRVVACRTKRHRLLRLLNYLHFLALSRHVMLEDASAGVGAAAAASRGSHRDATASPARPPHPTSHLCAEKRQSEFVVMERRNCGSAPNGDDAAADKEVVLPAATRDLEIIERHMLRTASVFVKKQECASLPSLRTATSASSPSSSSSSSSESVVMAIDRMQVVCDVYDSELGLLQAKLQLAQLLLKNGLEYSHTSPTSEPLDCSADARSAVLAPAAPSSSLHPPDALLAVLQRRPLIDFSHAYFYESYAAETLHLELQASLQQQIHDHFAACEKGEDALAAAGQEAPNSDWLDRQAIRADLLTCLLWRQSELLQEAEQRWLCVDAVGELHALHQAVYEQILVSWKLIVSTELAATPAQCLEHGGDSVLSGSAWLLVFPTKLVLDCCRNTQQQSPRAVDAHADSVAAMVKALAVIEWHQSLGRQVYEAKLLERVYVFQHSFVREKDAGDAATRFFFGDAGRSGGGAAAGSDETTSGCARASAAKSAALVPVALELIGERDFIHLTTGSATGSSKTVSEWLEAQLRPSLIGASHEPASASAARPQWQTLFLDFQRLWTRFLGATVRYQDLIGSEVFEFASCSPSLFLEATSSPSSGSSSQTSSTASAASSSNRGAPPSNSLASAKAVQGRYAEEIAEKMKEEMQQNCYPYWVSLARLKEQVRRQFEHGASRESDGVLAVTSPQEPTDNESIDGVSVPAAAADPRGVDTHMEESELEEGPASVTAMMERRQFVQRFAVCAQYLRTEGAIPEQLVRVNQFLNRFRGERTLMQMLNSSTACAFTPSHASEVHDSCKKSTLMRWLTGKLQQLREDLHSGVDATRSGDCARSSHGEFGSRSGTEMGGRDGGSGHYAGDGDSGGDDSRRLLLLLPSPLYLIDQFAVPLCRDPPTGALAQTHALANEERVETLRLIGSILEAFHVGTDLVRLQSSFVFAAKRLTHDASASGDTRKRRLRSSRARDTAALGLLECWQILYHDNLRAFHARILEALQPSVASCNMYARTNADKVKLANRSQREALQAIRDGVRKAEAELAASLQCMTSLLRLQTTSSQHAARRPPESGLSLRRREQELTRFRRCLLTLSTRLRDLRACRAIQRPRRASEAPVFQDAPVASSASDVLQMVHRASSAAAVTLSDDEVCTFWNALAAIERDDAHVSALTHWVDLQLVFLAECVRSARLASQRRHTQQRVRLSESATSRELDVSAIAALDKLWDRYELIAGAELASSPTRDAATGFDRWPLPSPHRHHQSSFACREDLAPASSPHSKLPSRGELLRRVEFLRLSFELQWLQTDITAMERHYEAFLDQKQRSQERTSALSRSSRLHWDAEIAPPTLVTLRQFYRGAASDGDAHAPSAPRDAFVVPASEMSLLLQDLAAECARHRSSQADAYEDAIASLRCQLVATQRSLAELKETARRDARQEAIKREAFAIDRAYQLRYRLELLRREGEAAENRMHLERLDLQCQLSTEFDRKLAAMHAQLLAKQQRFDEFRVTMQHDLHAQLQGAQAQLVHQLVDHSGSLSVETKAGVLANLHGQRASEHVAQENVALKQTLLRLQALLEMQRQSHGASHEREQALLRRHKTANLLLRREAAQLQQQVAQLEADVAKASHEKTCYMLKWSSLQKQTEAAAHKKREAKIRALSAPHHRATSAAAAAVGDDDLPNEPPAVGMGGAGSPRRSRRRAPLRGSFDDDEEAFERRHEVAIRRPSASPRPSGAESERDAATTADQRRHLQNSARHYQNEIRRLQQQLAKETKSKAALMDEVTHLRAADADSNQALEGDTGGGSGDPEAATLALAKEGGDLAAHPRTSGEGLRMTMAPAAGARAPSQSPRTRAQSASVCAPSRPPQPSGSSAASGGPSSTRPSTSFSPRSSSLYRAQVAAAASPRSTPTSATLSPAVSHGPAAPTRRFDVQKRSAANVGGVAGVPNVLSMREPLPYR